MNFHYPEVLRGIWFVRLVAIGLSKDQRFTVTYPLLWLQIENSLWLLLNRKREATFMVCHFFLIGKHLRVL